MGRDLALERTWRKRMREHERSGLTIQQFCQQERLVDHQFSWWRSELKRRTGNSKGTNKKRPKSASPVRRKKKSSKRSVTSAGSFLPVHVESSFAPTVEIVLDQPPRVRITRGFDAALLREVLRTVEQLGCSVLLPACRPQLPTWLRSTGFFHALSLADRSATTNLVPANPRSSPDRYDRREFGPHHSHNPRVAQQ